MTVTVLVLLLLAALPRMLARHPFPGAAPPAGPGAPALPRLPLDTPVLLDLTAAALASGTSVPGALRSIGEAVLPFDDGGTARALTVAGRLLVLGATWDEAWDGAPAAAREVADCLQPAWVDGADPGPLLVARARSLRAGRAQAAEEAAARLGVRLVLPLGLCFLPAFVLLGILPVVLGSGLDLLGH